MLLQKKEEFKNILRECVDSFLILKQSYFHGQLAIDCSKLTHFIVDLIQHLKFRAVNLRSTSNILQLSLKNH